MISRAIESVGGILNASTDREATLYYTKVARDHFDIALDVLTDMYNSPLFVPDEVERERGVILEELAMTYDQPDALADLLIDKALWPDQPMGRDVGGTPRVRRRHHEGATRRLPRAAVRPLQHRRRRGRKRRARRGRRARRRAAWVRAGKRHAHDEPGTSGRGQPGRARRGRLPQDGPGRTSASPSTAPPRTPDDRYPRGHDEHRPRRGDEQPTVRRAAGTAGAFAYDVHSSAMHYHDCGALLVSCGVDTSNADKAVQAILREQYGMQEGVAEEEHVASRGVRGGTPRSAAGRHARRSWGGMGGQELLRNEVRTPEQVVAGIRGITTEQVTEAAAAGTSAPARTGSPSLARTARRRGSRSCWRRRGGRAVREPPLHRAGRACAGRARNARGVVMLSGAETSLTERLRRMRRSPRDSSAPLHSARNDTTPLPPPPPCAPVGHLDSPPSRE